MSATESNFNCGWRLYNWKKPSRRNGRNTENENNVSGEERKEKSPQDTPNKSRPDLRMNVFISKESTSTLAKCVLFEQWGEENANLYKYIDYTWRSALFNKQVFAFTDKNEKECLVFHSGLQRRLDGEFIYLVLVPNDDQSKAQKWRIASAPSSDWSFKIAGDLLQYVDGDRDRLPRRCRFYNNPAELLFDTRCVITVDWVKSIDSCRQRIQQEIVQCLLRHDRYNSPRGHDISSRVPHGISESTERDLAFEVDQLKQRGYSIPDAGELRALFITSFGTSEKIVKANPYFVVPQGFVDSKKGECRLELLLPLFVNIDSNVRKTSNTNSAGMMGEESPKIRLCFALALQREESYNGYKAMSILTPDMAYTNARLVGLVNSAWLLAAAWPDIYSSPLLLQHNPHKLALYAGAQPAAGGAMTALVPQMHPMTRVESAPLTIGGDDHHFVSHPTMTRSGPPGRFSGIAASQPPTLGRMTAASKKLDDDVTKRSLFVRNIPAEWSEDFIKQKFSDSGKVNRITMLPNRNKDSDKQLCLITMDTPSAAIAAVKALNEDEDDGLKVQKQRGRPNRLARSSSAEEVFPSAEPSAGVDAERWPRSRVSASTPATFSQRLTLRVENMKPSQTANALLELLHFADVDDSDIEWINVYHPDNVAFVRFKTPQQLQRAYETFMSKGEYSCKIIKNPQFAQDTAYWKFGGTGEKLTPQLSDKLERAQYGQVFYENPNDPNSSARITRYDGTLASRFSPDTQSSVPLIRVQISSWRSPRRWANSRLRRGHVPQSTPLNAPPREHNPGVSLPLNLGSGGPPGVSTRFSPPRDVVNERKEQSRRTLNPNAVVFNPQASRRAETDEAGEEDDLHHPGATFVPQPSVHLSIPRGSELWGKLVQVFGRIPGWDITDIFEWQNKVRPPNNRGLTRRNLFFVGLPGNTATLEKDGFIARHGDSGRGKLRKFTFWNSAALARSAFGDPDLGTELDYVFCEVYLTQDEFNNLAAQNCVKKGSDVPSEPIPTIVPKFIFHTSQRRVGHI